MDEQRCFHTLLYTHFGDTLTPTTPVNQSADGSADPSAAGPRIRRYMALDHAGGLVANLHGAEEGVLTIVQGTG